MSLVLNAQLQTPQEVLQQGFSIVQFKEVFFSSFLMNKLKYWQMISSTPTETRSKLTSGLIQPSVPHKVLPQSVLSLQAATS